MALTRLPELMKEEESPCSDARCGCDVVASTQTRSRILIVDDEPLFGQTMSLLLGMQHDVTVERSGRAALERLLRDGAFDMVLCDVSLPDLSGPRLYEHVLEHDPELARRFVFITGGAFTPSARDFLGRYRGKRLDKPFTLSELERVLAEQTRLSA